MEFVSVLIIAVVTFIAGIFVGRFIAPNAQQIKVLEDSIEENKLQHATYKEQVAEHFSESASMFGDITEKYRSLYEHMSSGAYNLCDRRSIPRELSSSHVNILAVESPEVAPKLTDRGIPVMPNSSHPDTEQPETGSIQKNKLTDDYVVNVTRSGLSPLDPESQLLAQNSKQGDDKTAEIIDLDSQRSGEEPSQQAKDYAIKAKGVINHNSLNQEDIST